MKYENCWKRQRNEGGDEAGNDFNDRVANTDAHTARSALPPLDNKTCDRHQFVPPERSPAVRAVRPAEQVSTKQKPPGIVAQGNHIEEATQYCSEEEKRYRHERFLKLLRAGRSKRDRRSRLYRLQSFAYHQYHLEELDCWHLLR